MGDMRRKGGRERWLMDSTASLSGETERASPSSSLWQLIPRLSSSLTSCGSAGGGGGGGASEECGAGGRGGDVHTQQKFSSVGRRVNHQGYYCRAGRGTLQFSETAHWLLQLAGGHTAEMCPPLQTAGAPLYNQAYGDRGGRSLSFVVCNTNNSS